MMKNVRSGNVRGQAIIEAIAAVAVVVLLLTGLVVGTVRSVRRTGSSRDLSRGVQYAQEDLELVRGLRDAGWTVFTDTYAGKTYCNATGTLSLKSGDCAASTDGYVRQIDISAETAVGTGHQVTVTSTVTWNGSSGPLNTTLDTVLTDWKQ